MSEEYLKEDFDPATLKVAKLRGILVDHGVRYASNAKKPELVALFHKHVRKSSEPATYITVDSESDHSDSQQRKLEVKKQRSDTKREALADKNGVSEASQREESSGKIAKPKSRKSSKNGKNSDKSHTIEKPGKTAANDERVLSSKHPHRIKAEDIGLAKSPENPESKLKKILQATESPNVEKKDAASSKAEKVASTPQKPSPSSKPSSSRKRKSMLDEVDMKLAATPTKGNIFEVDSDSDSGLLSARRKKTKYDLQNNVLPSSPRINKTVNSAAKSPQTKRGSGQNEPAEDSAKDTSKHEPLSKDSANTTHVNGDVTFERATPAGQKSANVSQIEKSALLATPARNNTAAKIQTPVLQKILPEPESTESSAVFDESMDEPSIFFKSHQSFDASLHPRVTMLNSQNDSTESAAAAHSFDSALSKLKRETRGEDVHAPAENSHDLANLLNFGASSIIVPRPERGNVTPRRHVIVPQETLSRSSESGLSSKEYQEKFAFSEDEDEEESEEEDANVLELTAAKPAKKSETATKSPKTKASKSPKSSKKNLARPALSRPSVLRAVAFFSLWLTLVGGLLFGYWYREQTFLIGYCGSSIYRRTIPNTPETPQFLVRFGEFLDSNYRPHCVECPQHARCFPRLEIACYEDFVASTPWYYPYFPHLNIKAQKCVSDTKKAEKIEIMIDVALDLLRARNANVNCGRSDNDLHAGLDFSELHDLLLALKAPYITEEEFEELWARSVIELEKEPEIITRYPDDHHAPAVDPHAAAPAPHIENKVFRSTSLSHTSVTCMMSNTVLALAIRFKRALAVLCAVSVAVYGCYWKYRQNKTHALKVETIYHEVLSKLRKQAKAGKMSRELPEYIGSVQLRDSILSSEANLAYKMRLWQAVSHKVDRNTNVKSDLLEVHGEVMKVWQWIADFESL